MRETRTADRRFIFPVWSHGHARLLAAVLGMLLVLAANLAQAATTTTSLASSANPVGVGTSLTLTATVTTSGRLLTGLVSFVEGRTTLCGAVPVKTVTLTTATATCTLSTLAFGTHSITATYYNDSSNTGSTSPVLKQSVLYNSTTTITATPSPSLTNQTVTLQATVAGTSPGGTVSFIETFPQQTQSPITWCSGVALANGMAGCSVAGLTTGSHYFHADYPGDASHMPSTSNQIQQDVALAPTPVITPGGSSTPVNSPYQVLENSDAGVTLDGNGALVILAPPVQPYIISASAPENALIRLPQNQAIAFSSGGNTLLYTDLAGGALLLVRKGASFNLEVAYGTVQIDAALAGITLPLISPNLTTTAQAGVQTPPARLVIVRSSTSLRLYVEQGSAEYRRLDQSPGSTLLYAGENLRLDAAGAILGVTLGTWQGRLQLPGDPLPAQSWHEAQTRIPRLGGGLPRFGGATTLLDILRDALAELLGTQLGQQGYDSGSGVITYSLNGQHYRLIPLGEVSLLVNQLTSSSLGGTAGGVFELASRGIQISLAGSVGYFTDLQATLKNIDANATMTLNPGGVLEIHLNGGRYAALPGIAVTLPATPTPIPGFEIGPTGLAAFRDHLGAIQTLYPAFIDTATLVSVASGLDPAATLGSLGTGWVDLATQGVTLRLQPDYAVIPLPAGRENDAWWQENGHFYLRNADQSAQGFGVQ